MQADLGALARADADAALDEAAGRSRAGIQSVEVGFALLAALAASRGPLMLRDLAAAADMSAAKAHRYLVSFQRLGLVVQEPASTRYDLGPAALSLGLAALTRLDAVRMARERLALLAPRIGHTLALAVWGNHGPTIVHWQESPLAQPVNLRLGDVMPLLTSATGRCFAAWMCPRGDGCAHPRLDAMIDEELRRLAGLPRAQRHADLPTTRADVRALLAEVRARGMARVVDTLQPGIGGFCAPVFDSDARMVLGVVALGPAASFDTAWGGAVEAPLREMARQLSRDLGWREGESTAAALAPEAAAV